MKTKIYSLILAVVCMFTLTACSGGIDMVEYVTLELESTFHNDHSQDLVDMYTDGTTVTDLEEYYDLTVAFEAESFIYYYCYSDPTYLSQETYDRAVDLFAQMFNKVTFEVLESNEIDGDYHITVKANIVDTISKGITEQELMTIVDYIYPSDDTVVTPETEDEFMNLILDEIENYLPQTSTSESKTVTIIVEVDSEGGMAMDLETLDNLQVELIPWYAE